VYALQPHLNPLPAQLQRTPNAQKQQQQQQHTDEGCINGKTIPLL